MVEEYFHLSQVLIQEMLAAVVVVVTVVVELVVKVVGVQVRERQVHLM